MKRIRVLALARYGQLGASSRLRMAQYLPALERAGFDVTLAPLLRDAYLRRLYQGLDVDGWQVGADYLKRTVALMRARRFDLLWIEKELFPMLPPWTEAALARLGARCVVDYDDAVFHNYDQAGPLVRTLLGRKIDRVMAYATTVVCGSRYLAERAIRAGARRVELLPTVVDLARYQVAAAPRPGPRDGVLTVGWIGSPSTVRYLADLAPLLATLARTIDLRLRVVGAEFGWPGLRVECRAWSEQTEAADIRAFDVGVMPLPDSPWERGKCGYKLIQYMACGVPVVASAVGANVDIVQHGEQGWLARDERDWAAALSALAADRPRGVRMGRAGRRRVEQAYCVDATAPKLAAVLREAAIVGAR